MSRKIQISRTLLETLYLKKKLSTHKIGLLFNCWSTTIGSRLKEYDIPSRPSKKSLKLNRALLHDLYINKNLSPYKIASQLKCDPGTVRRWLIIHKIPIRKKKLIKTTAADLKRLYFKERLSLKEISDKLGCTPSGLLEVFRKLRIRTRTLSESSKYHTVRLDFKDKKDFKSYLIGFRLGDLHVRKFGNLIRIGSGTTKEEQVRLFWNLFKKYGIVYVGNKDERGAWHPEVSLNKTFIFLLPKHERIPKWIRNSRNLFLNFFAGYTDAEGNIGCYPRARLKITSYDYGILQDIKKQILHYLGINVNLYLDKLGPSHHKRPMTLVVNNRGDLLKILYLLKTTLRHQKRRIDLEAAIINIKSRLSPNYAK